MWAARLALLVAIAATGGQLYLAGMGLNADLQLVSTKESMRRLASLTAEAFPGRNPSAEKFWKVLGREGAILDNWGGEFQLEKRDVGEHTVFLWRSAGPDGSWGTLDDLEQLVTFRENPDTLNLPERGAPSIDAK